MLITWQKATKIVISYGFTANSLSISGKSKVL